MSRPPVYMLLVMLAAAATGVSAEQAAVARIDAVFERHAGESSPGCAVGVVRDGELVLERGYGMASLEHGVPNSGSTVFYIGSTSKQFVAASVLLAEELGHLALDADIRTYLPELPSWGEPITVRQLIHHTSGLRDYLALMRLAGMRWEDVHSDEAVLELLARQRALNFAPGEEHQYSNTGYFLLAEIVERATSQSLREFAAERIFRPLGMDSTHFHDDRTMVVPRRAAAYSPADGGGYRLEWYLNFDKVGSGGLLTTVRDLALWDSNFYDNRLGRGDLIERMLAVGRLDGGEELDYAHGLVRGRHRGLETVAHAGGFMGFRAQLLRFPERRLSVICLCNAADANAGELALAAANVLLEGKLARQSPAAQAPRGAEGEQPTADAGPGDPQLSGYAGAYRSPELAAVYRLEAAGEQVALRVGAQAEERMLFPTGQDELRGGGLVLRFRRDSQGRVSGYALQAGRIRDLDFERVAGAPPAGPDLLRKAISRHDPKGRWSEGVFRLHLEETRPDGPDRRTTLEIDNRSGRFVLESDRAGDLVRGVLDGSRCEWTLDGSADIPEDKRQEHRLTCERLELLRNYYTYLWGLPMKLADEGTLVDERVRVTEFEGRQAWELRVTYDPEVGGDTWYFYFDPADRALIGYRFYHDEAANDGEYIVLEGTVEGAGLTLPRRRAWYTHQDDRHLGTDTLVTLEVLDR